MTATQYATRAQRAQRILDAGMIAPENPARGEWSVKSETDENLTYHVNTLTNDCPCIDHSKGNCCKHLIAAQKAAALYQRPGALHYTPKRSEWFEEIDR